MPVISTICQRVCWLADGQVRQIGPTEAVIAEYLRDGERTHGEVAFDVTDTRAATVDVRLLAARVVHRGRPTNTVPMNEDFGIEIEIEMLKTLRRGVTVSFHMYDNRGALVLCAGPSRSDPATVGRHKYLCQFPANLLNSVGYTLSLFVVFDATEIVIQIPDALAFEAVESKRAAEYMGHVGGAIRPTLRWQSEHES